MKKRLLCSLALFTFNSYAQDIIPGRYLIKIKENQGMFSLKDQLPENTKTIRNFDSLDGFKEVEIKNPADAESVKNNPNVEFIEPIYKIQLPKEFKQSMKKDNPAVVESLTIESTSNSSNHKISSKQWGLEATNGIDIDILEAWKTTQGNPEIVVAVVDSGIDYNHPDLSNALWHNPKEIPGNLKDDDKNGYVDDTIGWDFLGNDSRPYDLSTHGTHVAGIIAAQGKTVWGVAPHVKVMPLRFIGGNGSGSSGDALEGMDYAIKNGAKIINNSWGGGSLSRGLKSAFEAAKAKGVLVVTSAGNSKLDLDCLSVYPASYHTTNVLGVASVSNNGVLSRSSTHGAGTVGVAAPGVFIYSTMPGGRYASKSGTSMASPMVAGLAALVWSVNPLFSHQTVRDIIIKSSRSISGLHQKIITSGMINAAKAMELAQEALQTNEPVVHGLDSLYIQKIKLVLSVTKTSTLGNKEVKLSIDAPASELAEISSVQYEFLSPSSEGLKISSTREDSFATIMDTHRGGVEVMTTVHLQDGRTFNKRMCVNIP